MKYSLITTFSQDTVEILNQGNYTLCCFLASKTENPSLFVPLCWSITKDFLQSVLIEWEDTLCSYLSTSEIKENSVIYIPQLGPQKGSATGRSSVSGSSYQIELKQRMLIENSGKVSVDSLNTFDNVLIQNNSNNRYSTGISIYNNSEEKYYGNCTFNSYYGQNIKIAPVNKAFLMFTNNNIENNTVVSIAENPGIMVDLTASADHSRTVSYDMNNGWSSNGQTWAKKYPSGTNLKTFLLS
ncbi:hypothetical protein [Flavobacterium ginsengisoli]|uniref:hypothetical protein n=1 Tax=Flavobacterium ginsengisoli TaxID=871694 RepID=UPI00241563C7|nr:hypothetical protein [Flavobacterium ginsengisoli]